MVGFDLELFEVFFVALGSEGGPIVCHKLLHNNTTVKTDLLKVDCCLKSFMGVEVRLHLGVDESGGMIRKTQAPQQRSLRLDLPLDVNSLPLVAVTK